MPLATGRNNAADGAWSVSKSWSFDQKAEGGKPEAALSGSVSSTPLPLSKDAADPLLAVWKEMEAEFVERAGGALGFNEPIVLQLLCHHALQRPTGPVEAVDRVYCGATHAHTHARGRRCGRGCYASTCPRPRFARHRIRQASEKALRAALGAPEIAGDAPHQRCPAADCHAQATRTI